MSERCPACGTEGPKHELGSAQVWDGGVRLVCQHMLFQMCKRTDPPYRDTAVLDRVQVCEHCLPLRRAVLARMAAARRAAGLALSTADRRALTECGQ